MFGARINFLIILLTALYIAIGLLSQSSNPKTQVKVARIEARAAALCAQVGPEACAQAQQRAGRF